MRLGSNEKVAILLHDGVKGVYGKTGLALLRFSDASIVAVIDRQCAGESLPQLTGINRNVPIVILEKFVAFAKDDNYLKSAQF